MRKLPSLSLTEQVSSGPGARAAPAAYTLSGKQFMQSEVFGGGAVDVRSLGRRDGLNEFAFAFPGSNIRYRIWTDRRYRLRRELIVDPGHRIYRTFRYGGRAKSTSSASPSTVAPTGAAVLIQGDSVRVDQGGAVAIVGRRIDIHDGGAFLLLARNVRGNVNVALDWRGIVAAVATFMLLRRFLRSRRQPEA